jgi:hypothetical protein
MTQTRTTGMPTLDCVLQDLQETLAELEWRATATNRTVVERARDLEAANAVRNAIEALRRLEADDLPD